MQLIHRTAVCHFYASCRQGVSGRAAAARIIAADVSAVPTDSPLRTVGTQRLSTAAQRFEETLLSKMATPMQLCNRIACILLTFLC